MGLEPKSIVVRPNVVTVASVPFRVLTKDVGDTMHMGQSDIALAELVIDSRMPEEVQAQTLLHELVHVWLRSHNLKDSNDNEVLVNVIANSMFDTMRQNPHLVAWIMGAGT